MHESFLDGAAAAALVVTSYAVWSFASPVPVVAGFVSIEILVVNHARDAAYAWHESVAYLQDDRGNRHAPISSQSFALAPGANRTVRITFDIPAPVRKLTLWFQDGIPMNQFFAGRSSLPDIGRVPSLRTNSSGDLLWFTNRLNRSSCAPGACSTATGRSSSPVS